jgi:hypothetical protein
MRVTGGIVCDVNLASPHVLAGGHTTWDRRLDRVPDRSLGRLAHLARDLPHVAAGLDAPPRSRVWPLPGGYRHGFRLDQGEAEGCVGAGWGYELAATPVAVDVPDYGWCQEHIYWPAQERFDPWAGGSYPGASPQYGGTTVDAGAQACRELGALQEWRWSLTWQEWTSSIIHEGPGVGGLAWTTGMFHPAGREEGGHCVCFLGFLVRWQRRADGPSWANLDPLRSGYVIPQSWGRGHGVDGLVFLPVADLWTLWAGGDWCVPVRRSRPAPEV